MIIRISELKLKPGHSKRELELEIRKVLHLKNETMDYEIVRQSVDARKKTDIRLVYIIDVTVPNPAAVIKKVKNKKTVMMKKTVFQFLPDLQKELHASSAAQKYRPVIIGSGPAGLFCALMLARSGFSPLILERGECVDDRIRKVEKFWQEGKLDPESNVQFGEGGAGTFSDGKLNTLIKDNSGLIRYVLNEFVKAGADEKILYEHKPHIGTDVLVTVIKHIRNEIIAAGGTILFNSCVTLITPLSSSEHIYRLQLNHKEQYLDSDTIILAIGHSARDTFSMLHKMNMKMEAKAFAVGLRIQHEQQTVDQAMYGENCPYEMGAAPYKLTHKCDNGRGVYSFCMCPGGYVVNASSEAGRTAVNGMSYSGRDSGAANSAIIVTVTADDYGDPDDPLSGIRFQRVLEEKAYAAGQGRIPVQTFGDFKENRPTKEFGHILPSVKGQITMTDLSKILPPSINESIIEGINAFERVLPGFADPEALLMGVESRTSSPVRLLRDDTFQSSCPGIFPCGEGAGYAGGITSAAADGIRIAEAVCRNYLTYD